MGFQSQVSLQVVTAMANTLWPLQEALRQIHFPQSLLPSGPQQLHSFGGICYKVTGNSFVLNLT